MYIVAYKKPFCFSFVCLYHLFDTILNIFILFPVFRAARFRRFMIPARARYFARLSRERFQKYFNLPETGCRTLALGSSKVVLNLVWRALTWVVDLPTSISKMIVAGFPLNIFSVLSMQVGLIRCRNDIIQPSHSALVSFWVSTLSGRWSLYFFHWSTGTFTLPIIAPLRRNMSKLLLPWTVLQVYSVGTEMHHSLFFAHMSSRASRALVFLSHLLRRAVMSPIILALPLHNAPMSLSIFCSVFFIFAGDEYRTVIVTPAVHTVIYRCVLPTHLATTLFLNTGCIFTATPPNPLFLLCAWIVLMCSDSIPMGGSLSCRTHFSQTPMPYALLASYVIVDSFRFAPLMLNAFSLIHASALHFFSRSQENLHKERLYTDCLYPC